ncbi:hypothetical protein [Methylobacterium komagatae]
MPDKNFSPDSQPVKRPWGFEWRSLLAMWLLRRADRLALLIAPWLGADRDA